MKNVYLLILLFAASLMALTSCEEEKTEPSKQEMISKTWKVAEVKINGTVDGGTDYSAYRYVFKTDGTYTFTEANGTTRQGTWEFNSTEQKIILDKGTDHEQTVSVLVLNETTVELEFTIPATFKSAEKKMIVKLRQ